MQGYPIYFLHNIYSKHLAVIKGIKFTCREVEIIACLISGRAVKRIAAFLSIAPKTVETHMRNIMLKLECNSREEVIDFIEKSEKFLLLKNYYISLLTYAAFEQRLRENPLFKGQGTLTCNIIYHQNEEHAFVPHLVKHLKIAGIETLVFSKKDPNFLAEILQTQQIFPHTYTLYIVSQAFLEDIYVKYDKEVTSLLQQSNQVTFLGSEEEENFSILKECNEITYIRFAENYYLSFFKVLKRVSPRLNLDALLYESTNTYNIFKESPEKILFSIDTEKAAPRGSNSLFLTIVKSISKNIKISIFFILLFSIGIFYAVSIFLKGEKIKELQHHSALENSKLIRSDFPLPSEKVLLHRSNILKHIEEKLNGSGRIQAVALTGIGGIGKTTLARQYAFSKKSSVVWEINAETKESLRDSFENLAYALALTEKDKSLFKNLQAITVTKQKEKELISFVKERLKLRSPWFLLYDNVEQYDDIQAYLPTDTDDWGAGKIILTTRDRNICNNWHIDHVITIEALHPQEAFTLFTRVLETSLTKDQKQKDEVEEFLKHLPPFPLDISTAAYYLKATNINYKNYLSRLSNPHQDFALIQENVLKDAGNYTRTRYSIIILSLQHLLKTHKEFKDLLLFMCLLDSQSIPQELLNSYKGGVLVDNFIYHLKKYSLITDESLHKVPGFSTFSIHRSTQELSLTYLKNILDLKQEKLLVQNLVDIFDQYMEKIVEERDILRMKSLVDHVKAFLRHPALLTGTSKGKIERGLGTFYSFIGNYDEAQEYLERALVTLRKHDDRNSPRIACALLYLGFVYKALGHYEKAKNVLEESLIIYTQYYPEDHVGLTKVLLYLGAVHDSLGEYQKARHWFEQSLDVCNKYLPENDLNVAWALANLGITNRELGRYEIAKKLLEKSLTIFRKRFPEKHVSIALILTNLGSVYRELGEYDQAKNLTQKGLTIYKEVAGDTNIRVAWALTHLGNIYKDMKEYKHAKELIERGIAIYKTTSLVNNDRSIAWASAYLGIAHRELGNYQVAKDLIKKSLMIYEKHYGKHHTKTADLLIHLSQVLLLEGQINKAQIDKAESLLNKALGILQQDNHPDRYRALEILADVNLEKALQVKEKGDQAAVQNFKQQARHLLNQALEIIQAHFPANSSHFHRVQTKALQINP